MTVDIALVAARQLRDYDAGAPGGVFAAGISLSEAQAYAVQAAVCRLREQRGETVVGYKIGCTSSVIQQQLGIDHPVFGRLFASEHYESGVAVATTRFDGLAIEGELAVLLAEDVPGDGRDRDQILRCVRSVFPVIELHNHVLRAPTRAAAELIANNALHAGFVSPRLDSSWPSSEELALRILLDGASAAETPSFRWREHVVRAVAQLSGLLAAHGLSLCANQVVLTGSLARLIPIRAGTSVAVSLSSGGSVTATFPT